MDFLSDIFKFENNKTIIGLTNELNVFFVLESFKKSSKNIIVLTSTLYEANKLYNSLKSYENNVFLFLELNYQKFLNILINTQF